MKKLLASAVAALALTVTANVASAEEQDVAKIKCSEFLQSGSTMPLLIMWIDGYLSAASDNTTMDDAYIEELGNKLGEFCGIKSALFVLQISFSSALLTPSPI